MFHLSFLFLTIHATIGCLDSWSLKITGVISRQILMINEKWAMGDILNFGKDAFGP